MAETKPSPERAQIMINATNDGEKIRLYLPGAVMGDDGAVLVDPEILIQLTSNMRVKDMARRAQIDLHEARQRIQRELERDRALRGETCESIARVYDISKGQVSKITQGDSWRYLQNAGEQIEFNGNLFEGL